MNQTAEGSGASFMEKLSAFIVDKRSLIFLITIANVGNLSFRLPNMETLDEIGGAVLGFVKGFIYCVLLCWVLSFFGLIIGKGTMSDTVLGRFFLAFEFITKGLM